MTTMNTDTTEGMGENPEMPEKIPVECLLKLSRQEIGKLESYVAELEDKIEMLQQENQQLRSCEERLSVFEKNQIARKVYEDELNKRIATRNVNLARQNKELKSDISSLIDELVSLRKQLNEKYAPLVSDQGRNPMMDPALFLFRRLHFVKPLRVRLYCRPNQSVDKIRHRLHRFTSLEMPDDAVIPEHGQCRFIYTHGT